MSRATEIQCLLKKPMVDMDGGASWATGEDSVSYRNVLGRAWGI